MVDAAIKVIEPTGKFVLRLHRSGLIRHQVDHLLLGACIFSAGVLFKRLHDFHHD